MGGVSFGIYGLEMDTMARGEAGRYGGSQRGGADAVSCDLDSRFCSGMWCEGRQIRNSGSETDAVTRWGLKVGFWRLFEPVLEFLVSRGVCEAKNNLQIGMAKEWSGKLVLEPYPLPTEIVQQIANCLPIAVSCLLLSCCSVAEESSLNQRLWFRRLAGEELVPWLLDTDCKEFDQGTRRVF
jgi:hypothetical protein